MVLAGRAVIDAGTQTDSTSPSPLSTPSAGRRSSSSSDPTHLQKDYINRLPTELLSDIFLRFCPDGFRTDVCQSCSGDITKTWWAVPWTCHRWRQIALGTPRFWAVPLYYSQEVLEAMLTRSRGAPLTINLHEETLEEEDVDTVFDTVLAHLDHIENLVLHCSRATLERAVEPGGSLMHRAPLVRTCSITCTDSRPDEEVPCIPLDFLAGDTPRLDTLHLSGCWATWSSPLLRSPIRVLVFTSAYIPYAEERTAVLDALERMPLLKHLIIYRKGNLGSNQPSIPIRHDSRTVVLPDLRQCVLMTGIGDTCALIDSLVLPPTAAVTTTVDMPDMPNFAQSTAALAHSLSARYAHKPVPGAPDAPLRSVRILASVCTDTFRLSAAAACQPNVFTNDGPPSRAEPAALTNSSLDVVVSGSLRLGGSVPIAVSTLLHALPVYTVSELVVDFGMYTLTPAWWRAVVECMPALDTVVVYGHNAADTLFDTINSTVMSITPQSDSGETDKPMIPPKLPFPALRSLALVGLDFAIPSRCTALVTALRRRGNVGVGMHRLCLRGCTLPQKRLLELQVHVRDYIIMVDERTKVPSESPEYTQESAWVVSVEI